MFDRPPVDGFNKYSSGCVRIFFDLDAGEHKSLAVNGASKITDGDPQFFAKFDIGSKFRTGRRILLDANGSVHNGSKAEHLAGRSNLVAIAFTLWQGPPFGIIGKDFFIVFVNAPVDFLDRVPGKFGIVEPAAKSITIAGNRIRHRYPSIGDIVIRILRRIATMRDHFQRDHLFAFACYFVGMRDKCNRSDSQQRKNRPNLKDFH